VEYIFNNLSSIDIAIVLSAIFLLGVCVGSLVCSLIYSKKIERILSIFPVNSIGYIDVNAVEDFYNNEDGEMDDEENDENKKTKNTRYKVYGSIVLPVMEVEHDS
jgi:hypothetical protein